LVAELEHRDVVGGPLRILEHTLEGHDLADGSPLTPTNRWTVPARGTAALRSAPRSDRHVACAASGVKPCTQGVSNARSSSSYLARHGDVGRQCRDVPTLP